MPKTPVKFKYNGKDFIMLLNVNDKPAKLQKLIFSKIKGKPLYWYLKNGYPFNFEKSDHFKDIKSGTTLILSDSELDLDIKEEAYIDIIINKSSIVDDAQYQLQNIAKLKGMKFAIGMPDIHPGPGCPIGASFITQNIIYPHLIGGDIGCGMLFCQLSSNMKSKKVQRMAKNVKFEIDKETKQKYMTSETIFGKSFIRSFDKKVFPEDLFISFEEQLGTIGGGNHFAELQEFVEVYDKRVFDELGLLEHNTCLMIHSGSRVLGKKIQDWWKEYLEKNQGLEEKKHQEIYLKHHDEACVWAKKNRTLIAQTILDHYSIKDDVGCTIDVWHNNVEKIGEFFVHRKGANPADKGCVVIPGSRGDYSYLVQPTSPIFETGLSLSHGAGRKWSRSKAKIMVKDKKTPKENLYHTKLDSLVICDDMDNLYEEVPEAYKSIDEVVGDMEKKGLLKKIAKLKPIVTWKC